MTRQNKHLCGIATVKIFTPEECTDIIKSALNIWTEKEATILSGKKDINWRNATLFIPPESVKKSVWFQKIINTITSFNNDKEGYGFDITGMLEPPNMLRYMAPDINPNKKAGKYDWHIDLGSTQITSMRKLSYSILLNAGEYEGGELEFHIGNSQEVSDNDNTVKYTRSNQNGPEELGTMILFPSYLTHRVLPVTKGTRYAIVGWVHGDSFR